MERRQRKTIMEAMVNDEREKSVDVSSEVPRLESACAVRLLSSLSEVREPSSRGGFAAAALKFRSDSLLSMPSFVDVMTDHLLQCPKPPAGTRAAELFNKLCRKLALITSKAVPNDSGDKELDQWVSNFELCATERSTDIEKSSTAYQLLAKAMVDEMGNKLRDMLGADWLGILLLRSQRLVWHGGQDVRCNPPQPKVSVDALVQSYDKQSSSTTVQELHSQESPQKKIRTEDYDNEAVDVNTLVVWAGEDTEMGETLAGTYALLDTNHYRNVYSRTDGPESTLLYFWDDRDGENQMGWWFGCEVGGEDVWAHNPQNSVIPPQTDWTMLHSGEVDASFAVTIHS